MLTTMTVHGVLALTGLFFLFTGVMSIAYPVEFAKKLGLEPIGWSGEIEVRGQYGGFFSMAAILQFLAVAGIIAHHIAFATSLVIFGGLFAGRIIALLFRHQDRQIIPMIYALFWIDAAGSILSIIGLYLS